MRLHALRFLLVCVAFAACKPKSNDAAPSTPAAPVALTGVSPRHVSNETAHRSCCSGGVRSGTARAPGRALRHRPALRRRRRRAAAHVVCPKKSRGRQRRRRARPDRVTDATGCALGRGRRARRRRAHVVNDVGFVDVTRSPRRRISRSVRRSTSTTRCGRSTQDGHGRKIAVGDGRGAIAAADGRRRESIVVRTPLGGPSCASSAISRCGRQRHNARSWAVARARESSSTAALRTSASTSTTRCARIDEGRRREVDGAHRPEPAPSRSGRLDRRRLAVDGEVQLVAKEDGRVSKGDRTAARRPDLGGHTRHLREVRDGGKGVRRARVRCAASRSFVRRERGSNTGPEPDHMGVQEQAASALVDVRIVTYPRHLGFNDGSSSGSRTTGNAAGSMERTSPRLG